jgi:CheY-like chemotaxis protein/DNA-binding HxlR family transcriptional regulator
MMKVLLVDDNLMFLTQLEKFLSQHEVVVETAQGGLEAVKKLEQHTYDVVVLDLKMPDMSGLDVLRQARDWGVSARFIMLTGYGDIHSAVETMKLGAIDYVQKPFEGKELLESIQNAATKPLNTPLELSQDILMEQLQQLCKNTPVLGISEVHPHLFTETCGITPTQFLWLKDPAVKDMVATPNFVLEQISQFSRQHDDAVVIQYGLSLLRNLYGEESFSHYIEGLQHMAQNGDCQVALMFKVRDQNHMAEALQRVSLYPAIEGLLAVLGHEIRCIILQLLNGRSLRYRDLFNLVDVKHSSDLSHHLKVLRDHNIITKHGAEYKLTGKGRHYVTALETLTALNAFQQKGPIIYFPLQ